MATSMNLDPFDMWRQAFTKLEEGMNSLGTRSLRSDEAGKALLEISKVSMQMQHVMEKALGRYFKAINLPSRREIIELGETLRRIEDRLDQLLPAPQPAITKRPARTRRPAAPVAAGQASPGPASPAPKSRRAVGAKHTRKEA